MNEQTEIIIRKKRTAEGQKVCMTGGRHPQKVPSHINTPQAEI